MGIVTDPSSLPAFSPVQDDDDPLRARVFAALVEQGYEPSVDGDGDLAVVVHDQRVFVRCLDTVPPLVRVFGQWLIGDEVPGNMLVRLNAANAVTAALNLVKATVHEDRLAVAVDLVISDGLALPALLAATCEAAVTAVQTWHATVLELCSGGPVGGGGGGEEPSDRSLF